MPCDSCPGHAPVPSLPLLPCTGGCLPDTEKCQAVVDSSCVVYTGPALSCIRATGNICMEQILQKIDTRVCEVTGDFTAFNLGCLREGHTIATEREFAESIAAYTCQLRAALDTFTTNTFPTAITGLQAHVMQLDQPQVSACSTLGIATGDNIRIVLHKLSNGLCEAISEQDISAADWNKCFTLVGDPPQTILQGFNTVIDYICSLRESTGTVLPVFDNTGSCLVDGTADESLVDTVLKIKSRLCATPVFSTSNLPSNGTCVNINSTDTLEQVTGKLLSQVGVIATTAIRGVNASQFALTDIDPQNPCLGQRLSLQAALPDRWVAATTADNHPGTLADKLVAGNNITINTTLHPGQVMISAGGGAVADEKVKSSAGDATAGYLEEKITGSQAEVTIATSINAGKVQIAAAVDYNSFIDRMLDMIEEDEDLKNRFCSIIAACPSPCQPPTNVQIIQVV